MIETFDEYQERANSTAVYPKERGLEYIICGLAGEIGELSGKYSKIIRDNNGILTEEKRLDFIKELGDIYWFSAQAAKELNTTMKEVATLNIQKLQDRANRNVIKGSGDER